jgi:CxxC motif-containing protein (DUF1111 family)
MTVPMTRFYRSCLSSLLFSLALAGCGGGSQHTGASPTAPTDPSSGSSAPATSPPSTTPPVTTSPPSTTPPVTSTPPSIPTTPAPPAPVAPPPPVQQANFVPLTWPNLDPATQYTLADGTLVTHIGGRTRDRHAREQPDPPPGDPYFMFAAHYFERRSHDITIYENVSPTHSANRIVTIVVRPQWWLYGTNFRDGFIGRRNGDAPGPTAVALYADNGGVKALPAGSLLSDQDLKTPLANYDSLPSDPSSNYTVDLTVPLTDGQFVLVKQITNLASANPQRPLQPGDLLEFELGIFLAGDHADPNLGRFNYYSDVLVYKVGTMGVHAWYRGPCCDGSAIPWDSHLVPDSALSGGQLMTLQEDTSNQPDLNLSQAGTNIAGINIQPFLEGRRLFHTSFLTGNHTEAGNPPLLKEAGKAGPKFQQSACILCHVENGKSSPVVNMPLSKMAVLTGDNDAKGNPVPDSRFGGHLEQGLTVENNTTFDGRQAIMMIDTYNVTMGAYPDQTPYSLQTPHYVLTDIAGNALPMPTRMSVRTAPHIVGMGLLEAVPESTLQALATASRSDPDGAYGKLQIIPDLQNPSVMRVGRFGWRATTATVLQQTAAALNSDIGVTTSILPLHLCGLATSGADCRAADAKGPLLSDSDLDLINKYASLLAVPVQRHFAGEQPIGPAAPVLVSEMATAPAQITAENAAEAAIQASVARGATLFDQVRCSACHVSSLTTGPSHRFAELRSQTIHPYTDLLLHDMGPDLADNYPQGVASAQEWRTAPLWGLGLLSAINPDVRYLHDGRARSIEEAILWHGGQGAASRDRFKQLSASDRQSVIDFVTSR